MTRLFAFVAALALIRGGSAHGSGASGPGPERFELAAPHMGTTARLVVYAPDRARAETAAQAALARIAELDALLSDYRDDSEVARLARHAGGRAVAVGPDLLDVLVRSQELALRSGGAFDVTVGPLSRLWRRARRTGELPSPEELRSALALVGHGHLVVDPAARTARLSRPGMRLDLGGIAKGYAADEALRVLRRYGLDSALVTLGGEVIAGSPPPGREGWTVALRIPGPEPAPLLLRDRAASTSGDAEQWLEVAGRHYSHIFDPRTGQALVGHRSVTVVARQGLLADGLATALSVLGRDRGLALIEGSPDAAALWVEGARVTESARWSGLPRSREMTVASH